MCTYPAFTMFEEVIYIIYLHTQTYTHSMGMESRITTGCEIKLQNTKQTSEYNSYFKFNIQLNSSTAEFTLSRSM